MKPVTVSILKKELSHYNQQELIDICLQLAKFKIENKELLTYLLFDAHDEDGYIEGIKEQIDVEFSKLNQSNLYYLKKSVRKILRMLKKYIRYSKKKETEAAILLHFCRKFLTLKKSHLQSQQLINIYERQLGMAKKAMSALHEDLQYDFQLELDALEMI